MKQEIKTQLTALQRFLSKDFFVALFSYLILTLFFAFLSKLLANFKILVKLDLAIQNSVVTLRSDSMTDILKYFTDLGDTKAMVVWTILAATILFWKKHYIYSMGIALTIGVTELITFIIKNSIGRHRPPELMALVSESSPSFPSGHTIAAVSFYGFLIYFFYKKIQNRTLRNILMMVCFLVILLAGFTRIYLGAHWPSDTFASYAIAGIWLTIIIILTERHLKKYPDSQV